MKRKTVTLTLAVEQHLADNARKLADLLAFCEGDGITVTAVQDSKNGVVLKDGKAVIHYTKPHVFYRELGVLCENARKCVAFEIFEDAYFEELSVMIDTSRNGVEKVDNVKRMIEVLAVMGYSMMMLYTEDTFHIEGRPYFGYMRARYTPEELREMDDYAYSFGIEAIPCIECYGHMNRYLIWPEAKPIKDTKIILLAREEQTFEFLDQMIRSISSCFRSKRIHIGMDEAWDMGRGAFLDKHGYVPPEQIFAEYMERLIGITNKYGLRPMMWSDMYWRNVASYGGDPDRCMLPDEIVAKIPPEVELVYWHYGEQPYSDHYMLQAHKATGHNVIYAGGNWGWIGHFPENHYAMLTTRFALEGCRKAGVKEAMLTLWTNDNAENDLFGSLLSLSFFAENCYNKDVTEAELRERFAACTGGEWDAFLTMSNYHNNFENEERFEGKKNYPNRFLGKPLFWQDIMDGLYDTHLFEQPMSGHYAASADTMKQYLDADRDGRWAYLYEYAYRVFDYLATKTWIAERLVPAYRENDRDMLALIASDKLPELKQKTVAVHEVHKAIWMAGRNMMGWANMDVRYGGMASRCDTVKMQLERYLAGVDTVLTELEEPRLYKKLSGFVHYSNIVTPNEKI